MAQCFHVSVSWGLCLITRLLQRLGSGINLYHPWYPSNSKKGGWMDDLTTIDLQLDPLLWGFHIFNNWHGPDQCHCCSRIPKWIWLKCAGPKMAWFRVQSAYITYIPSQSAVLRFLRMNLTNVHAQNVWSTKIKHWLLTWSAINRRFPGRPWATNPPWSQ